MWSPCGRRQQCQPAERARRRCEAGPHGVGDGEVDPVEEAPCTPARQRLTASALVAGRGLHVGQRPEPVANRIHGVLNCSCSNPNDLAASAARAGPLQGQKGEGAALRQLADARGAGPTFSGRCPPPAAQASVPAVPRSSPPRTSARTRAAPVSTPSASAHACTLSSGGGDMGGWRRHKH